jgi:hypothetical protein
MIEEMEENLSYSGPDIYIIPDTICASVTGNNAVNYALNLTLSHSSVTLATPVDFTTDAKYPSLATQCRSYDIAYNVHADTTTRKFVGSRIWTTMKIPPAADQQDQG